jgi:hypothetical protein
MAAKFQMTLIKRGPSSYPQFGDAGYGSASTCAMDHQVTPGLYYIKCPVCGTEAHSSIAKSGTIKLACKISKVKQLQEAS